MRILIIKLGAIGDVIRTTSIIPGLVEKYKSPEIHWATKKQSSDVLKGIKEIKRIFVVEKDIDEILNLRYDLIISLDDDFEVCRLASQISSKKIVGSCLKEGQRSYTEDSSSWFSMGLI